jgi:hypothetical protein
MNNAADHQDCFNRWVVKIIFAAGKGNRKNLPASDHDTPDTNAGSSETITVSTGDAAVVEVSLGHEAGTFIVDFLIGECWLSMMGSC